MSTYTTSDHQLSFENEFKTLRIHKPNGETEDLPLNQDGKWVSIQVVGDNYVILTGTINLSPTFAFNIRKAAQLGFALNNDATRMGGTVIVDLRDIGRYSNPEDWSGNLNIEYNLEATAHFFWREQSPKGLKLYFADVYTPEKSPA